VLQPRGERRPHASYEIARLTTLKVDRDLAEVAPSFQVVADRERTVATVLVREVSA